MGRPFASRFLMLIISMTVASVISSLHEDLIGQGFVVGPSFTTRDVQVSQEGNRWILKNKSDDVLGCLVRQQQEGRLVKTALPPLGPGESFPLEAKQGHGVPQVDSAPFEEYQAGSKIYFDVSEKRWFIKNIDPNKTFFEVHLFNMPSTLDRVIQSVIYSGFIKPGTEWPIPLHDSNLGPYDHKLLYIRSTMDGAPPNYHSARVEVQRD
ncbi:hypothetical protein PGTUg99_005206 [Puccinia graminis f. sp. tritici]|uniref:Uncharacterized protein n=1 Tax=Puccinia graminis f. sp. tritici TaxID=56615 RepID=A0A5B0PC48_PUCGR|nr:hypothetical protein PGTUg99_005206 [Puccinia graminis f. sp. tritici]